MTRMKKPRTAEVRGFLARAGVADQNRTFKPARKMFE
jgi:hypothetical protein